jgi:hypothetical protein
VEYKKYQPPSREEEKAELLVRDEEKLVLIGMKKSSNQTKSLIFLGIVRTLSLFNTVEIFLLKTWVWIFPRIRSPNSLYMPVTSLCTRYSFHSYHYTNYLLLFTSTTSPLHPTMFFMKITLFY